MEEIKDYQEPFVSKKAAPELGECSICFEEMHERDSFYLKNCWHRFHRTCINQFVNPDYMGDCLFIAENSMVLPQHIPIFDSEIELHIGENGEMLT